MKKVDLSFFFSKIVAVLGIAIFVFLSFANMTKTTFLHNGYFDTIADDRTDNLLACTLFFAILIGIAFLEDNISKKIKLIIQIAVVSFFVALCIYFIFYSKYYVLGDQAICYTVAKFWYEGNEDWTVLFEDYLRTYPHQFYLIEFFIIFFKITRTCDLRVIQIAQCIVAILGVFSGNHLCDKFCNLKKGNLISTLLLALFIPYWIYSVFIYGDIWGISFTLIGLNLYYMSIEYIESSIAKAYGLGIASAVILALAFNFRMLLFVVMIAIIIISILNVIKHKKLIYIVIPILTVVLMLGIKTATISYGQKYFDKNVSEGVSVMLYLAMGMNNSEDSCGGGAGYYNAFNIKTYERSGYDKDAANEIAKQYIADHLELYINNPSVGADFLYRKILQQWNIPDNSSFEVITSHERGDKYIDTVYDWYLSLKIYMILGIHQVICNALTLVYFINLMIRKRQEGTKLLEVLPGLIIVGGFMASIIWEASARYTFPYGVLQCLTAARGLYFIKDLINKCIIKIKGNREVKTD